MKTLYIATGDHCGSFSFGNDQIDQAESLIQRRLGLELKSLALLFSKHDEVALIINDEGRHRYIAFPVGFTLTAQMTFLARQRREWTGRGPLSHVAVSHFDTLQDQYSDGT